MAEHEKNAHHISDWLELSGLSQDEASVRAGYVHNATLNRLVKGKQSYKQEHLEAFGPVLGCEPWELVAWPPGLDHEFFVYWRQLEQHEKREMIRAAEAKIENRPSSEQSLTGGLYLDANQKTPGRVKRDDGHASKGRKTG
jgi:hypothetical protein